MFRKRPLDYFRYSCILAKAGEAVFILFFVFFTLSCEFQPSEIPLTVVNPPDGNAPVLYINVQPDMDTLKLAADTWTEFKFSSPETSVQHVKITFDDNVVYDSEYNPDYRPRFYIALGNYNGGLHSFVLQAFTSTNTGSIADKVGAESYMFQVEWPVIINRNVDRWLSIQSAEYKKGGTLVKWDKYDYADFEFYRMVKTSSTLVNQTSYTISNPLTTTFLDTTYLEGEYSDYMVGLNGGYGNSFSFFKPIQTPEVTLDEKNNFVVKWNMTQNPQKLSFYHVALKIPDTYSYQEIKKEDARDTVGVYGISPAFGNNYEFQVRYVPKGFNQPYLNYNSAGGFVHFSLGNSMKPFQNAFNLGNSEMVLLYSSGWFYKFDMTNRMLVDSIRINEITSPDFIRVSPGGQFFSYFTNSDFVMRRTSDWKIVSQFTTPLMNNGNEGFWSAAISDNYQLVVIEHWNVLTITDLRTGKEIFRKVGTPAENLVEAVINSEGTKILYNMHSYENNTNYIRLVNFDGEKLTELGETTAMTPGANYNLTQYAIQDDRVLLLKNVSAYNYRWEERDLNDFSLIYGFNLPNSFVPVAIDFQHKQVVSRYGLYGGFDNSYSMFYDFQLDISNKITPIVKGQKFVLSENILANGSGRYLPVNDLIQKP